MKIRSVIFIAASIIASTPLMGQKTENTIQSGNTLYKEQKYDQAEIQYNDVLAKEPSNTTAKFNLANTLYRRGKQDESAKKLDELIAYEKETGLRSQSFYNKGVILSAQKKLEESIEAYKNALRQDPGDTEARENLQKALLDHFRIRFGNAKLAPQGSRIDNARSHHGRRDQPRHRRMLGRRDGRLGFMELTGKD